MTAFSLAKRILGNIRAARKVGAGSFLSFHAKRKNSRVSLDIAGHRIIVRARTSDLKVVLESLTKEYNFLDDLLPGDFDGLIVDAGGYIGTAAIAFASRFPHATVVTIEPSSANLSLLEENVSTFANIHVLHAALGPHAEGTIVLRDRRTGNWGFTIVADAADQVETEALETVALTSLEQIKQQFGRSVAFLKLDIEGAEKLIFDQNKDQLQEIPLVFAELHDRIVPGCDEAFRSFSLDRWIVRLSGEKFLSIQRTVIKQPS